MNCTEEIFARVNKNWSELDYHYDMYVGSATWTLRGMKAVIVITFYSPSYLDHETAKGPLGLRVKLPPVYHTQWRLHTVPLIAERQAGKLRIAVFIVFGLTRPGFEPKSTALVADTLSTRPLIGRKSTKIQQLSHTPRPGPEVRE